ncbi:hypothetical protein [Bacillus cereus]
MVVQYIRPLSINQISTTATKLSLTYKEDDQIAIVFLVHEVNKIK